MMDPVNGTIALHEFSPTGAYANEVSGVAGNVRGSLAKRAHHPGGFDGTPALIFDIDDTTLTTYDYEIYSNFAFSGTTNGAFVDHAVFPATPGMVNLVTWARDHGYTVFFLPRRYGVVTRAVADAAGPFGHSERRGASKPVPRVATLAGCGSTST
jgi:HAD superfamily, subfamily IIIB (Acid phosphatase)